MADAEHIAVPITYSAAGVSGEGRYTNRASIKLPECRAVFLPEDSSVLGPSYTADSFVFREVLIVRSQDLCREKEVGRYAHNTV